MVGIMYQRLSVPSRVSLPLKVGKVTATLNVFSEISTTWFSLGSTEGNYLECIDLQEPSTLFSQGLCWKNCSIIVHTNHMTRTRVTNIQLADKRIAR